MAAHYIVKVCSAFNVYAKSLELTVSSARMNRSISSSDLF